MFANQVSARTATTSRRTTRPAASRTVVASAGKNTIVDAAVATPTLSVLVEAVVKVCASVFRGGAMRGGAWRLVARPPSCLCPSAPRLHHSMWRGGGVAATAYGWRVVWTGPLF